MIKRDSKVKYKGKYYWVKAKIEQPGREPLVLLKNSVTKEHFAVPVVQCKLVK